MSAGLGTWTPRQNGTSEKLHLFARLRISDRICEILTKSRGPPKVEDCKMELGPGSAGRGTRTTGQNWMSEKLHLFAGFWMSSPSSNLQPSGLLSAVHTHNLAVYSNLAAFGQAESLNRGRVQNVLRPKIGLNRGPKWEKWRKSVSAPFVVGKLSV